MYLSTELGGGRQEGRSLQGEDRQTSCYIWANKGLYERTDIDPVLIFPKIFTIYFGQNGIVSYQSEHVKQNEKI